jgi:tyrosyl-tRNA synthetase
MSISDELMWRYYLLCTDLTPAAIEKIRAQAKPMEAKRQLARMIIADFHGEKAAQQADEEFRRVFSERQAPTDIDEKTLPASQEPQFLTKIIVAAGLAPTNKEAQRLVAQGGVLVDDAKVDDPKQTIDSRAGKSYVLKVGKRRFAKVTFV